MQGIFIEKVVIKLKTSSLTILLPEQTLNCQVHLPPPQIKEREMLMTGKVVSYHRIKLKTEIIKTRHLNKGIGEIRRWW